eukprot:XP_004938306.3 omega-amidase NIT2 isoform X2 [Gallus gallus]
MCCFCCHGHRWERRRPTPQPPQPLFSGGLSLPAPLPPFRSVPCLFARERSALSGSHTPGLQFPAAHARPARTRPAVSGRCAEMQAARGAMANFRLALIQLHVSAVKSDNLQRACGLIREASAKGAKVVALPECFNSPYGTQYFKEYAEKIPGESTQKLSAVAKECSIYLVGGSIPEEDGGKLYNTCTVFGPDGAILAKHRKIHLFDINVPGKIQFKESETLSPGDSFSMFDTRCQLLIYPGAFNMTTGPAHWELLQRGRAVDNQVYVATVSPARDEKASYVAWGHSTVVNPWGEVIAKAGAEETVIYTDIDLKKLAEIRQQIPILSQKRYDLYGIEMKK